MALGYLFLYPLGYLGRPLDSSAAIWPAHALSFAAYLLMPARLWPVIALGMVALELVWVPVIHWFADGSTLTWSSALGFALANVLTTAGPAALARLLRLYRGGQEPRFVISPLWIVALFLGALPGSCLGALERAHAAGAGWIPANLGLWLLASVLTVVTFGPTVFGVLLGFAEPAQARARAWEGLAVAGLVLGLFVWFALMPWPTADELLRPMLFAVPLLWLALRFSHRATSLAVVVVASGVVLLSVHGRGPYPNVGDAQSWRAVVIAMDIFLLVGCGGAQLINLLTLRQRALLEELAREHEQMLQYARDLDVAEETARRATAADLHDGVGQILAGQSMTLAAMRAHSGHPLLAALVEEALAASREAQEGVRAMIQNLTPPELDQATLEETLQWLTELFRTRYGFEVTYRLSGEATLRRDQLRLVYRCIRELLMNACKHSQCRVAEVQVDVSSKSVEIIVIDQGIGFDVRRALDLSEQRFGLNQLRARIRTAGGVLNIDAAVGEGTRVTVRLPPAPEPALHG